MRKAGLLDKKPLTATRKMLDTARKDMGTKKKIGAWHGVVTYMEYESRYYFRAMVSADKKILEVDLFTRRDLAFGKKYPRFRIFLDREKEDFISWDMVKEKWSNAKIDMLETDDNRYSYSYRGRNHATKETLNIVNSYLYTGCMNDVETAVLDYQAKIRKAELSQKHKLVTDVIDNYMNMVPDRLPADWMKFINDRALEHSVFYTKDTGTGYCTHCRLHVPVPADVKHNMPGKCRQCGSRIKYKSWKMQKYTTYRTTAAILQKCTDGMHYVCRQFRVTMETKRQEYYVPEIVLHEDFRALFLLEHRHGMTNSLRNYEWGEFRYTGINRWCEDGTVSHRMYYRGSSGYERSVLYTGNLKKLLKDTSLQYVPVAEIVKSMGSERINVLALFDDMETGYPYESFWKMGLKRFVQERIERDFSTGLAEVAYRKEKQKPWEILHMTKEDMKQAVRLNATDQQMRIIQKAAGVGAKLTDGQVEWLDRYMAAHEILNYFKVQTPHRIIRYLREQAGVEQSGKSQHNEALHFWTDYLDMIRQMGWNLRDRSIFFPQDIKRAHDEAVAVYTVWEDNADAEKMRAKDDIMRRNAAEIEKAFCYSDDTYMIKIPECYLDFKHEGNAQHNCVATYYDRAVEARCIILFVRKRLEPDKSFCTVEIQNDDGRFKVMQNRTAYNREAPEDAKVFMKKAVKEAQGIADKIVEEGKRIRQKVAG
ncbi:MAG: PcfJ domain-containing protein [Lachnospiraceae bacterium]|nr:PcfJ domain-containing protein [Lachnospiraceae bacterium]